MTFIIFLTPHFIHFQYHFHIIKNIWLKWNNKMIRSYFEVFIQLLILLWIHFLFVYLTEVIFCQKFSEKWLHSNTHQSIQLIQFPFLLKSFLYLIYQWDCEFHWILIFWNEINIIIISSFIKKNVWWKRIKCQLVQFLK